MACPILEFAGYPVHTCEELPVFAEVLQYTGLSNFGEARWWKVGKAKADGEDLNYFGIEGLRIAGGQGIIIIAVCQVSLLGSVEPSSPPQPTIRSVTWSADCCIMHGQ